MESASSSTVSSASPPQQHDTEEGLLIGSLLQTVDDEEHHSPPQPWSAHRPQSQQHWPRPPGAGCCAVCGPAMNAVGVCHDCGNEALCESCVTAHRRVRMTREHRITVFKMGPDHNDNDPTVMNLASHFCPLPFNTTTMLTPPGLFTAPPAPPHYSIRSTTSLPLVRGRQSCARHSDQPALFVCQQCSTEAVCIECVSQTIHSGHVIRPAMGHSRENEQELYRVVNEALYTKRQQYTAAAASVSRTSDSVDARVNELEAQLRRTFDEHRAALNARENAVLAQLASIADRKRSTLRRQFSDFVQSTQRLSIVNGDVGQSIAALQNCSSAHLTPCESVDMTLTPVNPSVIQGLKSLSGITSSACAQLSRILDGSAGSPSSSGSASSRNSISGSPVEVRTALKRTVFLGRPLDVSMGTVDYAGTRMNRGGLASVKAHFTLISDRQSLASSQSSLIVRDNSDGTYTTTITPSAVGSFALHWSIDAQPMGNSPMTIHVRRVGEQRDYSTLREISEPRVTFGDGEISRPWGICVDVRGRVLVSDRSNNRLCVYEKSGKESYLMSATVGSPGVAEGQFNRPAGVTTNSKNEIVVADKDNHRIQVFTEDGCFVLAFGEKGRANRQFNYPWDVACNTRDDIAVSDTRNHRVQLFDAKGRFMRKFGFDATVFFKHFDSPRGLSFLLDGRLVVTDFNNHRLVILNTHGSPMSVDHNGLLNMGQDDNHTMQFIGSYGEEPRVGAFNRPQGVAVDPFGRVIVADSRNNRIHIYGASLQPVCVFGKGVKPVTRTHGFGEPTVSVVQIGHGESGGHVLNKPCDVACGPNGEIYVVDMENNQICVY